MALDTLEVFGTEYTNVAGFKATDDNSQTKTYINVSDTTAVASDVASGKYFYLADGTKTEGTASGGGSTETSISRQIKSLEKESLRYAELPETIIFSQLTTLGERALAGTTGCKIIVFPSVRTCANFPLADSPDYEIIDLGTGLSNFNGSSSTQWFFSEDAKLHTVILRSTTTPIKFAIANINTFQLTPFASGGSGGTLYVPADLISEYQNATNWSTILSYPNNQIKSIESTHTDPNAPIDLTLYYADGTPIS